MKTYLLFILSALFVSGAKSVEIEGFRYKVEGVADFAFSDSKNLTSVVIPNTITSIGNAMFYGCNDLTFITIPNSMTAIGYSVFQDYSLNDIYYYASVPPVFIYDEHLKYKSIILHVLAESIWFCKPTKMWK